MNRNKAKLTILVVDDEFIFRELNKKRIVDFLKDRTSYDILTADGSEKALEILKKRSIDLVFTDMRMDGKDDSGLNLIRKIKALSSDTQVFIVSNGNLEHILEKASTVDATGCFQLPLHRIDLESAFFNHL